MREGDPKALRPRLLRIVLLGMLGPVLVLTWLAWKDIETQQTLVDQLVAERRRDASRRGAMQIGAAFHRVEREVFGALRRGHGVIGAMAALERLVWVTNAFLVDTGRRQVLWPASPIRFDALPGRPADEREASERYLEMLAALDGEGDGGESFRRAVAVFEDYRSYRQQLARLEEAKRLRFRPQSLPTALDRLYELQAEARDDRLRGETAFELGQTWDQLARAPVVAAASGPLPYLRDGFRLLALDAFDQVEGLGRSLRVDRLLYFPIARERRADLLEAWGRPDLAGPLLLELLEDVVHGRLALTRAEFDSHLGRLVRRLERLLTGAPWPPGSQVEALKTGFDRLAGRGRRILAIDRRQQELLERLWPDMQALGPMPPPGRLQVLLPGGPTWFPTVEGDGRAPICYGTLASRPGQVFGFQLALVPLVEGAVASKLGGLARQEGVALQLVGRDDQTWLYVDREGRPALAPATGIPLQPAFEAEPPFGFWRVRAGYPDEGGTRRLAVSRFWVTLGLIVLSIGTVVVGGILAWRALERSLELARLKQDFVSNVTHELRTPLTSIRMFGEMLHLGRVRDDKKRQEYYQIIASESERLTKLIDNILRFSRMEAGKKPYHLEVADPAPTIRKAGEIVRSHLERSGFTFIEEVPEELAPVALDTEALLGAIINLLSNAMKYSGDGREIRLEAVVAGGEVRVAVKDRGIGVSPEDRERIFDKFYRGKADRMAEVRGSGLGLALVHHVVNAHRGRVEVADRPGGGSVFSLNLPTAPEPPT